MPTESTDLENLINIVFSAIQKFNSKEIYLIENDLSERCICSKFASYLEKSLRSAKISKYVVDVEYNRGNDGREESPKKLERKNIVVDLIVHKRGYKINRGFDNLLCIEMKKGYKKLDYEKDIERLKKLTDICYGFNYKAGFMILIEADKANNRYGLKIESVYFNGQQQPFNTVTNANFSYN